MTARTATGLGPLSTLRVVEMGSMLAGPFVGTMLGDFGAEVIKIEKPGATDQIREWPPHKGSSSIWWKTVARNKRPITLNLSDPEGRSIALKLFKHADIVVENFRPGTLEKWGLSPTELRHQFPRIVWVRVSGWGQSGPYRERGGFATIAEAFSGMASFTGFPNTGPMISAYPFGDYLAGIFGAYGALAAIIHRNVTGTGQIVDVSLFEPLMRLIETAFVRFDLFGTLKARMGNQMEEDAPRNIYETADGKHIAISCGAQRVYENLTEAMERPELKSDPRFLTMANRVANRTQIDEILAQWVKTQESASILLLLQKHGVVVGPVNTIPDVLSDQHVQKRDLFVGIDDADLGAVNLIKPIPHLSDTPGLVKWAGADAGSANHSVYKDLLALDDRVVADLANSGVI